MNRFQAMLDLKQKILKLNFKKHTIKIIAHVVETKESQPSLEHLWGSEQTDIKNLLHQNKDICAEKMTQLGCANSTEHSITLTTDVPVFTPPYRVPQTQMPILKEYLNEMIKNEIIRPTPSSAYAFSIVIVPKKTGEWRICIDYRKINKITIKDRYPLTRIDDIFNYLAGSRYFTQP